MEPRNLSPREIRRYGKQIMLPEIGLEGQEKIKSASVLVVGAGGLGCPVLQYLTAAGLGKIGIIEFDKVDEDKPAETGSLRFNGCRQAQINNCP